MNTEFVTVAGLYEKVSRAGTHYLFGRWGRVRLYAFPVAGRRPKDAKPEYRLCVHWADAQAISEAVPQMQPRQEGSPGADAPESNDAMARAGREESSGLR